MPAGLLRAKEGRVEGGVRYVMVTTREVPSYLGFTSSIVLTLFLAGGGDKVPILFSARYIFTNIIATIPIFWHINYIYI
jgi:hypothetical protein